MMFSIKFGPRIVALPLILALGGCVSFGGKAPASIVDTRAEVAAARAAFVGRTA
jgi:hypothetical protein